VLQTTMAAVREVMLSRVEACSLDAQAQREAEMALEELDVIWDELQGQAELLSRERERYGEFFDYAPDAYVITDAGGNIREANRAARDLLGADIVGRALDRYIATEQRTIFLSRLLRLAPGSPVSWETRLGRESQKAQLSVRAIPLRTSGVAGLCWIIRPL
jgi:PAS domain S-box-containing protein